MEKHMKRSFGQGVWNVIRFNWHFYVISVCVIAVSMGMSVILESPYDWYAGAVALLAVFLTCSSLIVTFYVYDMSHLYDLKWLDNQEEKDASVILNVSAGFDETSALLKLRYSGVTHHVMDFYQSLGEKEISIQRAKKAYPLPSEVQEIDLHNIPLPDGSVDRAFVIFAAHEIRDESDRIVFFRELKRVLRDRGRVFVVEHIRDTPNFIAYNIGFLHFLSRRDWIQTFKSSGMHLRNAVKHTPFVSIFTLEKDDGITP